MIRRALIALLGLTAAQAAEPIAGTWYTEGTENGQHILMVVADRPDHTFEKHFRFFDTCADQRRATETGTWKIAGTRYLEQTITVNGHPVDAASAYYHDAFDIGHADGEAIVMTDEQTHVTWHLQRVPDNFPLPDGGCTS